MDLGKRKASQQALVAVKRPRNELVSFANGKENKALVESVSKAVD